MMAHEFYHNVLTPGLVKAAMFAPELAADRSLDVLMTTIAGQESDWTYLVQEDGGAAHGLFQMQENDIQDIMTNLVSEKLFVAGMDDFGINTRTAAHLWDILSTTAGESLSVFLARLNLWCDPRPIPAYDDQTALFEYYSATWRPARPNFKRWQMVYGLAMTAVPA